MKYFGPRNNDATNCATTVYYQSFNPKLIELFVDYFFMLALVGSRDDLCTNSGSEEEIARKTRKICQNFCVS